MLYVDCIAKVFSENRESLSSVEDRFWIIDGVKMKSGIQKFRNYSHKIKSRLEDPIHDLQVEIPVTTIYVFPYLENEFFAELTLKHDEKIYANNFSELQLPILDEEIDSESYSLLVSVVQNASILNKNTNIYVDEPAQNILIEIDILIFYWYFQPLHF